MLRLNVKLSEVLLLRLRVTFHTLPLFFGERKFYARTHVKIKRQWRSALRVLKKRKNKFDCLVNEMPHIKQLRPPLNVHNGFNSC